MSNFRTYLENVTSSSEEVELDSLGAKEVLKVNNYEGQRNIKNPLIKWHLENIQAGQFFASQIVIGKFKTGRGYSSTTLDGQHRLTALVEANTTNKYKMHILTVNLRSKDECRLYYQMFNNKTSDRTLADLIKFKLSHTPNKNRWSHPVEICQSLPYATGHFFTSGGIKKFSMEQNRTMSKIEFLSDLLDISLYWDAFDFVWGNTFEGIEGIRNKLSKFGRNILGVKGYGVMIDSYIRHPAKAKIFWKKLAEYSNQYMPNSDNSHIPNKFFITLLDKLMYIKQHPNMLGKGTQIVSPIFYVLWKAFDQYRHGKEYYRGAGLDDATILTISNDDVLNRCFNNGLGLRQLTVPN
jgi:hypothetical protein